jgi:hypothetical protein
MSGKPLLKMAVNAAALSCRADVGGCDRLQ